MAEIKNYLLFKQRQSEAAIRFSWWGSPTDLIELIFVIWKLGIVRTLAGKPVSKKMLIKGFEFMFNIKLKNFEVLQSKAITRIDYSPFLTRLKQCFDNFVRSKLK